MMSLIKISSNIMMYRNKYYWIVAVSLVVCCCYATANLVDKPHDTSASEGQRVQFNCSTSDLTTPISWQYISAAQSDVPKDVFLSGILVNGYNLRFQMQGNSADGVYNLVIPSVKLSDAGTYRCRDQDGRREHVDVILNVTENTELHIAPKHAEAQVGAKVQLNCTTFYKTEPVKWQHIPIGNNLPVDVYMNGKLFDPYTSGYDVQMNNKTGTYNLIITALKLEDGGLYRCIEKEGRGDHKDAELTVIECQMFTIESCGTSPENVTLECNMTFSGKFPPVIQWVTAKGDIIDQGVATTHHSNRVTSTLVKEIDNPSLPLDYTCQATISKASCKPKNSVQCQTEVYDSSTNSNGPKDVPSTTRNNLRFLGFLSVFLIIPLVFAIVVLIRCIRRRREQPTSQELQPMN